MMGAMNGYVRGSRWTHAGRIIAKNFKSREQDEIRQLAEEGRALLWKIGEHCFLGI